MAKAVLGTGEVKMHEIQSLALSNYTAVQCDKCSFTGLYSLFAQQTCPWGLAIEFGSDSSGRRGFGGRDMIRLNWSFQKVKN